MYQFITGYDVLETPRFLYPKILVNSTNLYTIRLYSNGLFVSVFRVQGILIDPTIVDNTRKKHVLLTK